MKTRALTRGITAVVGLVLFLSTQHVVAQTPHWQRVGSCAFRGIDRLPSGRIVIAADGGDMYSSTDEGNTWRIDTICTSMLPTSISFSDNENGLVGAITLGSGAIAITSDGGKSWTSKQSKDFVGLLSVSAPSHDTLYASSGIGAGKIFRSTNAGSTWSLLTLNTNNPVWKVHFQSSRQGYVIGDTGFFAATTDAGVTWNRIAIGSTGSLMTVDWKGSRIALGGVEHDGTPLIALSRDSGLHWNYTAITADTLGGQITVIKLLSNDTVIAFESNNFFRFVSTDFGASWKASRLAPDYEHDKYLPANYYDGIVDGNGNGLFCGSLGTLYRMTDRGMSGFVQCHWAMGKTTLSHAGAQIEPLDSNPNWLHAVGDGGGLAFSSDQGLTWFTHTDPNFDKVSYSGLHFVSAARGILLTELGLQTNYSAFQRTDDTGRNWQQIETGRRSRIYSTVRAKDGDLYALGDSSALRSIDDGATWEQYTRYWRGSAPHEGRKVLRTILSDGQFWPTGEAYLLVYEIDSFFDAGSDIGKLAYPVYSVIRSNDAGATWSEPVYLPEGVYFNDLTFVSKKLGYVIGNASNLYRTTDGGQTWSYVKGLDSVNMSLMFNRTGTIGIAAGDYGRIFESTDSGYTWTRVDPKYALGNSNVNFWKGCFAADSVAILNSSQGFWRKTFSVGGKESVDATEARNQYLFLLAHPSPSRDIVTCDVYGLYSVSQASSMSCTLTDLLGRRIVDLTEQLQSHNNGSSSSFTFSTAGLSNGVYAVRLQTDAESRTARFVVLH